MDMENSSQIEYTKPKILDLGKISLVLGAECVGGFAYSDDCLGGASPYSRCVSVGSDADQNT